MHSEPIVSEGISGLFLHFNQDAVQSAMVKDQPDLLALGYTKTMMGFLFFVPKPKRIVMIGLGGGSLAKYCLKYLPDAHFTAVEINPKVIALREQFHIPQDNHQFRVICANGADYIKDHAEKIDVLLVDGFKAHGQPDSLSSVDFYNHCYEKLSDTGVLVVNLVEDGDTHYEYAAKIRRCFKNRVLFVNAESRGNKIAFAFKEGTFPPSVDSMKEMIEQLDSNHKLPLKSILNKIMSSIKTTRFILNQGDCQLD